MAAIVARNNARFIATALDADIVMMDLETGDFVELNGTASHIWQALEQPLTLEELIERLTREFEVPHPQCLTETTRYVEEATAAGFLIVTSRE